MSEIFFPIIILVVFGVIFWFSKQTKDRQNTAWKEFAQSHGLTFSPAGLFSGAQIGGTYADVDIILHTERRNRNNASKTVTVAEAHFTPGSLPTGLSIIRETLFEKAAKAFGGQDIEVDDPELDALVLIQCPDEDVALELLEPPRVRLLLYQLFQSRSEVALDAFRVRLVIDSVPEHEMTFEAFLDEMVEIVIALEASAEGGEARDELFEDAPRMTAPRPSSISWEPEEDLRDSLISYGPEAEEEVRDSLISYGPEVEEERGQEPLLSSRDEIGVHASKAELILTPEEPEAEEEEELDDAEEPRADAGTLEADEPPSGTAEGPDSTLAALVERLRDRSLDADGRAAILEEARGETVPLEVTVKRVGWSVGFDLPKELEGGRTVEATVADLGEVALRFPDSNNDEVDALGPGAPLSCEARVGGWDDLFERLVFDVR